MSKANKKFFIITLIVILPFILLLGLSGKVGVPSLFLYVKSLLSTGFVIFGIYVIHRSGSSDRLSFFCMTGLVFGALGDIFIELGGKLENVSILAGLLLFLTQHISWCTGMLMTAKDSPHRKRLIITMPASAAGVVLFIIALVSIINATLGDMMIPVFIYGIILTWAITIPFTLREKKDIRFLMLGIAAILFFISDALLVKGIFGGGMSPIMGLFNLLSYYYAQFLIALSMGVCCGKD